MNHQDFFSCLHSLEEFYSDHCTFSSEIPSENKLLFPIVGIVRNYIVGIAQPGREDVVTPGVKQKSMFFKK